ncbi:MAG: hypothetical protein KJN92_13135, partial [Gemmatimonadetes bacterium]|nr:hypothetical protein [Gemmatimonadota bacterium]
TELSQGAEMLYAQRVAIEYFLAHGSFVLYNPNGRKRFGLGHRRKSRVASFDWTAGQASPPVLRPNVPVEKEVILV